MSPLTKEQAEMVVSIVRVAKMMGQPLSTEVARTIEKLEEDAENYRRKAFEGGRVKRSKLGWMYVRSAEQLAKNAAMMRELRERFASWR